MGCVVLGFFVGFGVWWVGGFGVVGGGGWGWGVFGVVLIGGLVQPAYRDEFCIGVRNRCFRFFFFFWPPQFCSPTTPEGGLSNFSPI